MSSFVSAQVKAGEPNLAKLMKPSKVHPNGRVTIENGEVKNPKNKTTGKTRKIVVANQYGVPTETEIPEMDGNVTPENSVWRIALHQPEMTVAGKTLRATCPEEMYHAMTMLYEDRIILGKRADDFRPELNDDEMKSYLTWLDKKETKAEAKKAPTPQTL